jgi:hypothetical protein
MDDGIPMEPKKSGGAGKYIAVGCLSMVFLVLIGLLVGGMYVANNWKSWAAPAVTEIMANGIRDTDLTNDQKRELIARVETMGSEFEAGTLTFEDLTKIGEALETSPLIAVGIVEAMNAVYIKPSDLTDVEKTDAIRLNQRLARGIFEDRITPEELEPILAPLSESGNVRVSRTESDEGMAASFRINDLKDPEQITAEELRAYMVEARSLLEMKAIPDEPFEVDIIEEFDKVIESAIGRRIVPAELPELAPVEGDG